jgi:hypothetical protein
MQPINRCKNRCNTALPTARWASDPLIIGGEGDGKIYATVEAHEAVNNSRRMLKPMPHLSRYPSCGVRRGRLSHRPVSHEEAWVC